jgi:hypothetical protein
MRLEGLGHLKKIHPTGTRTRDLPACSIVPQPTTLHKTKYLYKGRGFLKAKYSFYNRKLSNTPYALVRAENSQFECYQHRDICLLKHV